MSNEIVGFTFIVFLIIAVFFLIYRLGDYRRELFAVKRYKIFAARDRIIRLVAEERIDENDEVFQFLYDTSNKLARLTRPLKLNEILSILRSAPAADIKDLQKIRSRLLMSNNEVKMATNELFSTMLEVILLNSSIVRLAIRFKIARYNFFRSINMTLSPLLKKEREAYILYRELEHAKSNLA